MIFISRLPSIERYLRMPLRLRQALRGVIFFASYHARNPRLRAGLVVTASKGALPSNQTRME
jgi:hypothetical protein